MAAPKHIKVLIPMHQVDTPLGTLLCMSWKEKQELDINARGDDPNQYYTVYGRDYDEEVGRFLRLEYIGAHLEITVGLNSKKSSKKSTAGSKKVSEKGKKKGK
jgi:hypothetical protein